LAEPYFESDDVMMWLYQLQAKLEKRFAPERANRWRQWKRHDPESDEVIAHNRWDEFLSEHVVSGDDGVNRVAYGQVSEIERKLLSAYLSECERVVIRTYAREEQFAFWLNVYNAVTVRTVLENYPIRSMRNVGVVPSWLGGGPWDRPRIQVEGVPLSLNDIEHRILRRNWRDPRIHYAVNCGATGCPNLPRRAFRGEGLSPTLDALATEFINSPRGVHRIGERLSACRIFRWFLEDFGGSEAALIEYLRRFAAPELQDMLEGRKKVDRYHYDWSLNDATMRQ